eukprot:3501165-Lingulodinium_polyedra.AAC.1
MSSDTCFTIRCSVARMMVTTVSRSLRTALFSSSRNAAHSLRKSFRDVSTYRSTSFITASEDSSGARSKSSG